MVINNSISQIDKVQIDYLIILASSNQLVQINKVVILMLIILSIFLLENLIKKPWIVVVTPLFSSIV